MRQATLNPLVVLFRKSLRHFMFGWKTIGVLSVICLLMKCWMPFWVMKRYVKWLFPVALMVISEFWSEKWIGWSPHVLTWEELNYLGKLLLEMEKKVTFLMEVVILKATWVELCKAIARVYWGQKMGAI